MVSKGTKSASAEWIVVTELGRIYGYSPLVDPDNAILVVDNFLEAEDIYTGVDQSGDLLYVADFGGCKVAVYDSDWNELLGFPLGTVIKTH